MRRPTNHGAATRACIMHDPTRSTNCIYPPVRHLSSHCPDQNHEMHEVWSVVLRKIIKIVATRRQILRLKCTKFDFGWGSAPDPAGELTALPRPLAGFKGLLLRGGEGGEGQKEREGKEGMRKKERGGRGKRKGGEGRRGMGGKV